MMNPTFIAIAHGTLLWQPILEQIGECRFTPLSFTTLAF